MNKKFLSLLAFLLLCATFAMAQTRGPIELKRGRVKPHIPGTTLSLQTSPFSAFQTADEVIITSEAVTGVVSVSICNEFGVIVTSETHSMTSGDEITLDISSLPAGAYTLYIMCGDDIYVGEFEVE